MRNMPKLSKDFAYFLNLQVPSEFGDKKLNANIDEWRIWIFRNNLPDHLADRGGCPWTLDLLDHPAFQMKHGQCLYPYHFGDKRRDYYITKFGVFIAVPDEIFAKVTEGAEVVDDYLWCAAEAVTQSLMDRNVILGRNDPEGYIYKYVKGFTKEEVERVRLLQEEAKKKHEETLKRHQEQLDALRNLILVKVPAEEADKIVDKIKYFDYYYDYSDDRDVCHRGREWKKELKEMLAKHDLSWDIVEKYHTGK